MVLKEYFNFEKNISNRFFSITSYEKKENEDIVDEIPLDTFNSFYILFNVGSLLPVSLDNIDFFCPSKDCLMGCNKRPVFKFNDNSYYKFIIIKLQDDFSKQILNKLKNAIDYPFSSIFISEEFCFSFSLNISIIEMLENIFKICGDNKNLNNYFFYLELEAIFLMFLSSILKIILFEEHKFNSITATPDLKFYIILRKIIINGETPDKVIVKYKSDKETFIKFYRRFFPKGSIK